MAPHEGEFITIGQSECARWNPIARIVLPGRFPSGTSPAVLNSSSSHLRMDKSDSTDVEFGKTVASPAQKRRSWWNHAPPSESHASLNVVVWSCWSMIDAMLFSLRYAVSSSRWSFSIALLWSSVQTVACSCAMCGSITSEMNIKDRILTRSIGMIGSAKWRPRYWLGRARLRAWWCHPICRSRSGQSSAGRSSSHWCQSTANALARACPGRQRTHAASLVARTSRPCARNRRSIGRQRRHPPRLRCGAPWTCRECRWWEAPTARVTGKSPNRAPAASWLSHWLWRWPGRTRMSASTRTVLGWAARHCRPARSTRRGTRWCAAFEWCRIWAPTRAWPTDSSSSGTSRPYRWSSSTACEGMWTRCSRSWPRRRHRPRRPPCERLGRVGEVRTRSERPWTRRDAPCELGRRCGDPCWSFHHPSWRLSACVSTRRTARRIAGQAWPLGWRPCGGRSATWWSSASCTGCRSCRHGCRRQRTSCRDASCHQTTMQTPTHHRSPWCCWWLAGRGQPGFAHTARQSCHWGRRAWQSCRCS